MRAIDPGKTSRPSRVDPGVAPMLQWIKIADLVVDDSYQRELKPGNWKAIKRIAEHFRWSRFSPVFVAPVEGGKFAVIDGQHRTHAAAICGMAEVPCQVVQMSREEQAASFAAVNGMVTKVTTWQIYKAALSAGEDWAVNAAAIASESGCRLMTANASHWTKKPGEIYGVTSFRRIVESRPRESVVKALSLLMATEGYRDNSDVWDSSILLPLLLALTVRGPLLDHPKLRTALEEFDLWAMIDAIQAETKERIRKGLPYSPKKEQLETRFGDWLDTRFPQRMAVPA